MSFGNCVHVEFHLNRFRYSGIERNRVWQPKILEDVPVSWLDTGSFGRSYLHSAPRKTLPSARDDIRIQRLNLWPPLLLRVPQVIRKLHSEPRLRGATQCSG